MRSMEIWLVSTVIIVSIINLNWVTLVLLVAGGRYMLYLELESRVRGGSQLNAYLMFVGSRVGKLGGRE